MRNLNILFTTEDKIFYVNEAKELQVYQDSTRGDNLFQELYSFLDTIDSWTSYQLSEMISCGLEISDIEIFDLWINDKKGLFELHPELFDYVEIDKCFRDLESNGNSKSVLAFIKVLESLTAKEYNKEYEYILQCHALARKLVKKEAKEAETLRMAKWSHLDDRRMEQQAKYLEQVINNSKEQIIDLGFTFEPRIELQNKKAS